MPTFDSRISEVVAGNDVSIRRTIEFSTSGFPTGTTITNAWLTVKSELTDADLGLFQKAITTTEVFGTGQIENDGSGDVDMVVRFDLVPADTLAIGSTLLRHFDIQVKTAAGKIYTPEKGLISSIGRVTVTT